MALTPDARIFVGVTLLNGGITIYALRGTAVGYFACKYFSLHAHGMAPRLPDVTANIRLRQAFKIYGFVGESNAKEQEINLKFQTLV